MELQKFGPTRTRFKDRRTCLKIQNTLKKRKV